MRNKLYPLEQIVGGMKRDEADVPVADVIWKAEVSKPKSCGWEISVMKDDISRITFVPVAEFICRNATQFQINEGCRPFFGFLISSFRLKLHLCDFARRTLQLGPPPPPLKAMPQLYHLIPEITLAFQDYAALGLLF